CPAQGILHGTRIRHQHLEITICTQAENPVSLEGEDETADIEYVGNFLGALEVFGEYDCPDRDYHWSPRAWPRPEDDEDDEQKAEREANEQLLRKIKRLKREGRLTAIYFPLKLFGSSPQMGLSWQQRQLHQAITRELTRRQGKAKSARPDKAEIVIGGQGPDDGVAPCPYLEKGE